MYKFLTKPWLALGPSGRPPLYGWFHLTLIGINVLIIGLIILWTIWQHKKFGGKFSKKQILIVTLIAIIVLWGIELIKQFCSFQYGKIHNLKYKYNFHWFIHFLCSVPLFTIPIYLCIYKENIFKRIFQSFNGIWTTSSGFFVIIYPGDVFSDPSWFINIHTSIYHTILFVYGSFLLISGVVRYHYKEFLLSLIIFFSMWAVAIILNELTYQILAKKGLIGAVAIGYEVPNFITISHRVPSPLVSQYDVFKLGPIKWSLIFTLIFYPLGMPLLAGVSYTLLGGTRSLIFWIISKFNTKQVKKNVAN